jgi:hypothetical protein
MGAANRMRLGSIQSDSHIGREYIAEWYEMSMSVQPLSIELTESFSMTVNPPPPLARHVGEASLRL